MKGDDSTTPLLAILHYSSRSTVDHMDWNIPRIYPLVGLVAGYAIVMFFNPIRLVVAGRFPLHHAFQANLADVHFARLRLFGLSIRHLHSAATALRSRFQPGPGTRELGMAGLSSKFGAKFHCRRWKGSPGFLITRRPPIRYRFWRPSF